MNRQLSFPSEPPKPFPKPELEKNMTHNTYEPEKGSLWFTHDPAIYHDPVSNNYYIYSTGAICQRSTDLIRWERLGKVVSAPPKESIDWTGSDDIWAPDIVKVGEEYRLYCSNSSWGVRQSCIFLAVSDSPEGPFVPKGCVLKTSSQLPVNAIDANIVEDEATREQYMVYGSFWGGCHILKLDKETGLAAEKGIGTCLARRPEWMDHSIEGPYIIYNHDNGYYYLFVSYGSLKNDYNIRVGRSKSITGPYLDHNGRDLTNLEDYDNSQGYLLACGYKWEKGIGYMGPGHNSVLHDTDGSWYLISHIREHDFLIPQISTMHIRRLLWNKEGWPIACPLPYAGETQQSVDPALLPGIYERIKLVPMMPQGILHSVPMILFENGKLECCSIMGKWKQISDTSLMITYGNTTEILEILPGWDYDLWQPCLQLTGTDEKNIAVWAKKIGAFKQE